MRALRPCRASNAHALLTLNGSSSRALRAPPPHHAPTAASPAHPPSGPARTAAALEPLVTIVASTRLVRSDVDALLQALPNRPDLLSLDAATLSQAAGLPPRRAEAFVAELRSDAHRVSVFRACRRLERDGVAAYARDDPGFPARLRQPGGPGVLFVRGEPEPADDRCLAIAGASACTPAGRRHAGAFAAAAVKAGWSISCGAEAGVDAAATQAVIEAGGRVRVVLPVLDDLASHPRALLLDRVSAERGVLMSTQPARLESSAAAAADPEVESDLLVTGLARALLIIESGEPGGPLVAARAMQLHWHGPVFALPGPIDAPTSRGANRLIAEGRARLVRDLGSFLQALEQLDAPKPSEPGQPRAADREGFSPF